MPTSRGKILQLGKKEPEYLEVHSDQYLIEWLDELGWMQSAGMDNAPLSFTEISAWSNACGIPLQTDPIPEALWLRQMSQAYVDEFRRSQGTEVEAPYG